MLLWVLLSLLPLVDGAHVNAGAAGVGSESRRTVGLLGGQEERELPVTLPEVVEDEEQEDGGDPYSTWHALYGTDVCMSMLFSAHLLHYAALGWKDDTCCYVAISTILIGLGLNLYTF